MLLLSKRTLISKWGYLKGYQATPSFEMISHPNKYFLVLYMSLDNMGKKIKDKNNIFFFNFSFFFSFYIFHREYLPRL